jgi:hypothetical protein
LQFDFLNIASQVSIGYLDNLVQGDGLIRCNKPIQLMLNEIFIGNFLVIPINSNDNHDSGIVSFFKMVNT